MDLTADGGRQRFFRMDCDDRDQDRHDPIHEQKNSGVHRLSDCHGADHAYDHDHCGPEHLPVENTRDRSRKVVISGSKHGQDQKHVPQHGAVYKRADDAQDQRRRKTHNQHQIQSRFRKQAQRFPAGRQQSSLQTAVSEVPENSWVFPPVQTEQCVRRQLRLFRRSRAHRRSCA